MTKRSSPLMGDIHRLEDPVPLLVKEQVRRGHGDKDMERTFQSSQQIASSQIKGLDIK